MGPDQKLLDAMSKMMDEKMAKLATKTDFESLKGEIKGLRDENKLLREEINAMRRAARQTERRVEILETQLRKNNLVLRGINYQPNADLLQVVKHFFANVLLVGKEILIESVRRIGPRSGAGGMLIVSLAMYQDKWLLIKAAPRLNGTGYSVSQDFPFSVRQRRSKLLRVRAELRKQKPGLVGLLRLDKLIVDNVAYDWDDEVGLRAGDLSRGVGEVAGVNISAVVAALQSEAPRGSHHGMEQSNAAAAGI
ncbi:Hypothetical protein NTJ_12550 [Nesidiocoris tenuis]|nr:Hypothetical protein NTJ_12550 [Nesidiocoris tenuis]